MSEDTYKDKEYEEDGDEGDEEDEDVSATSISDGFTRAQTILFGNGKRFRCESSQRSISAGDHSYDRSLQFSTPASLYILPSISISGNV